MSNPVQRLLAALREHGHEPRKAGDGWACRCPAHDDRNPSLSIHAGDDGRALVNCHAGCNGDAVCAAIGLRLADLFPDDPSRRSARTLRTRRVSTSTKTRPAAPAGKSVDVDAPEAVETFATAHDAVTKLERRRGPKAAHWVYTNAAGEPVGLVVRWNLPPDPDDAERKPRKDIQPVSKLPVGWANKGMPTPRPLYRLRDLLATKPGERVYVCEGEKAADACRAVGLVATTSPHGSNSPAQADWSPVAGRDVVILPDHDDAGEKYAAAAARLALAAGAKSVRIVRLVALWAAMPKGGDMADLVEHRGGDVDPIHAEVESLAGRTLPTVAGGPSPLRPREMHNDRQAQSCEGYRKHDGVFVLVEGVHDFGEVDDGACREEEHRDADSDRIDSHELIVPNAAALDRFKPFPVDVLPEPVRALVVEGSKAIGCDPSNVAVPLLAGLASAIGNTRRIALKRQWSEPAIVWVAIVADSGVKKSPPIDLALAAIRKRQEAAMREYKDAMNAHADALAIYERDAAHWKKGKDEGPPPTKPEAPILDRCWTNDVTTEKVAVLLQENPRGLLMIRDELAGWFNFDRYASGGGGDVAKWLEVFGGRAMMVDRKGGGTLYVPHAAVSIAGGIQPKTLRRALGEQHRDNGLAARLLFTMPPRMILRWTEADVSAETEAAVAAVFDRLYGLMMEPDTEGGQRPWLVELAPDGKRAWVAFYNEHAGQQAERTGDEAAAWSKLEGYAARLALVVHLTRWAAGDPAVPTSTTPVDAASIAAGVALVRWFGDEARRVYANLAESEAERDARQLVELIQRKGGDVSGRELVQLSRAYPKVADAEAALSALVEAGKGSWVTPPQRGRGQPKARRFVLSPVYGANVYRNAAGDPANVNCVDVDGEATPPSAGDGWGEV